MNSSLIILIVLIVIIVILAVRASQSRHRRGRRPHHQRGERTFRRKEQTCSYSNSDDQSSESESSNESEDSKPRSENKMYEANFERLPKTTQPYVPDRQNHPKPATVPTFSRNQPTTDADGYMDISAHGYRFEVAASNHESIKMPKNFSAIKEWEGMIIGVYDQERCGSCWAFATCSSFTDRIRIKSDGKYLQNGDYLSPFHLAACMKCGISNACPTVCEGNYLDDVLEFLVTTGAVAQSDITKHSDLGLEYHCFDSNAVGVKSWKGIRKYRANIFPPAMLTTKENLAKNETAIMEEIYKNGTVCCIIKVYVPLDKRNFYLYKEGIYGYGWESEPTESDGYHAINIVGWGEETTPTGVAKYWIVRNSWGDSWGTNGFGRILKGENFGLIESDVWAIDPDV